MEKWPLVQLKEHVDLITGFPFKSTNYTDSTQGIRLLRGDNVIQADIRWNDVKRWPNDDTFVYQKYFLGKNDVVLAMDRPWIEAGLKYAWINDEDLPCVLVQRVARMRGINGLDTVYLRYLIGSDAFTGHVHTITTGTAVPHISAPQIQLFSFLLPPLPIQRKIAAILSAYDDLIENNTRRIALLEQMAQAIYREWFVEYRYPGHEDVPLVESALGMVPQGWEVVKLEDVCDTISSGGTPARKEKAYWENADVPWFKTQELQDCHLLDSEEYITQLGVNKSSAKIFPVNTILMAIYAAPTVGRLGILTQDATCNQAACGLIPSKERNSLYFLYYTLLELRSYFNRFAQGAAQQNISVGKVRQTPIILPTADLVRLFTKSVEPIWESLKNLLKQNATLRRTRDLLLPKLISGEVDVSGVAIAGAEELPEPQAT